MTLLLRHWRERDSENQKARREDEEGEERKKGRGTDGETLRRAECSCMCVVTWTSVCLMDARKKVGQRISYHLLREERGGKEREKRKEMKGKRRGEEKKGKWREEVKREEEMSKEERRGEERKRGVTEKEETRGYGQAEKTRGTEKKGGGEEQVVSTDVRSSSPCIRLPSDRGLPLTLTFGPPLYTHTQTSQHLLYM